MHGPADQRLEHAFGEGGRRRHRHGHQDGSARPPGGQAGQHEHRDRRRHRGRITQPGQESKGPMLPAEAALHPQVHRPIQAVRPLLAGQPHPQDRRDGHADGQQRYREPPVGGREQRPGLRRPQAF
jgi:hypothetical protein